MPALLPTDLDDPSISSIQRGLGGWGVRSENLDMFDNLTKKIDKHLTLNGESLVVYNSKLSQLIFPLQEPSHASVLWSMTLIG